MIISTKKIAFTTLSVIDRKWFGDFRNPPNSKGDTHDV